MKINRIVGIWPPFSAMQENIIQGGRWEIEQKEIFLFGPQKSDTRLGHEMEGTVLLGASTSS